MSSIEDFVWVGLVSLGSCYQMAMFAKKIGELRRKHKVEPPAIDGDPEFVRGFRAQQNCIEFFPIFMFLMWISAVFFHQIPASLAGLYYMYARSQYFSGYVADAKKRVPPFMQSINALKMFLAMSAAGIGNTLLKTYLGINIMAMVFG